MWGYRETGYLKARHRKKGCVYSAIMDKSELGTVKGQNRNFALSTQNSHNIDYALNKRIIFEEIQLLSGYLS